jgi:hypothetical protein
MLNCSIHINLRFPIKCRICERIYSDNSILTTICYTKTLDESHQRSFKGKENIFFLDVFYSSYEKLKGLRKVVFKYSSLLPGINSASMNPLDGTFKKF